MAFLFPTVTPMELAGRPTINQLIRSHKRKAPLRLYQHANKVYPKATKAITGGVLGGLGDALAQYIEGRPTASSSHHPSSGSSSSTSNHDAPTTPATAFDWRRFFAFTGFNFLWAGVPLHFYINFLENRRRNFTLLQKMVFTHFAYNPFLYFPSFYVLHGAFMGQSLEYVLDHRMRHELPKALSQCLQFWIPVNMVQYSVVSAQKQVLFLSVANVAWCVILSSNSNTSRVRAEDDTEGPRARKEAGVGVRHQSGSVGPIVVEDGVRAVAEFAHINRREEASLQPYYDAAGDEAISIRVDVQNGLAEKI
eukprot:g8928.t1